MKNLLIGTFACLVSVSATAATYDYTWTDGTGDHKWGTPGNWKGGEVPTAGKTVEIPCGELNAPTPAEIIVDNDAVASFASVDMIYERTSIAEYRIARIALDVTTNVTIGCKMTGLASFRLRNNVTVTVAPSQTTPLNYSGFNILERGTFVFPQAEADDYRKEYTFGRFAVSNEATLVISPCRNMFYAFTCYGTLKNPSATRYEVTGNTTSKENPGLVAGPVVGPIAIGGNKCFSVTSTNNPTLSFSMFASGYELVAGIARFGSGTDSSYGASTAFQPDYDGVHFLYLGEGNETTSKTFYYQGGHTHKSTGYWNYPTTFDAGEQGGVTFTGNFLTGGENFFAHRLVFQGSNTQPCVLNNMISVGDWYNYSPTNITTYVTKRGTGTWKFEEPVNADYSGYMKTKTYRRWLHGVFAVEEGVLQFDSIREKGLTCSIGTSQATQREYKGPYDKTKDVDYAYLLGTATTNAAGVVVSATEGTMEFTGSNACTTTTRPFRLVGDGCISSLGLARIALGDILSITNGEKTLALAGATNDCGDVLKDIRDGTGTVSVVKRGGGTWTITGDLSFSGDLKVQAGTLVVSNATARQPYKWFRFTDRENAGGSGWFALGKIAFYDADGNRRGLNLTCSQPVTGYELPLCDYQNLAAGSVMFGRSGYPYFVIDNNKLSQLSSDSATANPFVTCTYLDSSRKRTQKAYDPDAQVPVVFRLADDTPEIVSYDLASVQNRNASYCSTGGWPSYWKLEGSPDGIFWDTLDTRDAVTIPENDNSWYSDGTSFTAGAVRKYDATEATPKGYPIAAGREPLGVALTNVRSVSVSAGATLVCRGAVKAFGELEVPVAGMGKLQGATLADAGTLDFAGVDVTAREVIIPADFSTLPDWPKLAGWTLKVNGTVNDRFALAVTADGFKLTKKGLLILIR